MPAQVVGGTYDKLEKLYSQGKYESCLFKADNYTYKPDNSRDAEPYLYIAMCFYQLSNSEDPLIKEDYNDGFKQAIKYTARFIKKDKEGTLLADNMEFVNGLKDLQKKEIKELFASADYRKAATAAKLFDKLNREEDLTLLYFIGINEVMSNNLSQGTKDIEDASTKLNELLAKGTYKADTYIKSFVVDGFLKYSEYLINQNQVNDAAKELEIALKIYPNDGYLKLQYNMVKQSLDNNKANK
jgi:hypothetical protein